MKQNSRYTEGMELRQCLKETQTALRIAQTGFNMVSEPELVDAYIYEIQSLQSRVSYLLRQMKELEGRRETEKRRRILQWG